MCGIAGILKIHEPSHGTPPPHLDAIPERWLDILDESIKHRGPDGAGRFRDRAVRADGAVVDVALVHRRLSIIDHAGGHQPMVHDGERLRPDLTYQPGATPIVASAVEPDKPIVAVVFNGCIYNHRELRAELEAGGLRFETDHSDTEVLVHGWRAWGYWTQGRIDDSSMFAIGLWDRAASAFATARDRFGQKPLYTTFSGQERDTPKGRDVPDFTVASNPSGLARLFGLDELRPDALNAWIVFGHNLLTTPFRRVGSIAPLAQHMTPFDESAVHQGRQRRVQQVLSEAQSPYASRQPEPHDAIRSFPLTLLKSQAKKRAPGIDALVRRSVGDMLESDVPIACLLSGGVDSSLVASHAHALTGGIRTITVRMPNPRYDESRFARAIAEHIGSTHIEVDAAPNAAEDLVRLIEQAGLPFGDSSLLPTYWACRAASEVATVLLTGDGGDEMFVGYQRHLAAPWVSAAWPLAQLVRITPVSLMRGRTQYALGEKARRFVEAARWGSYYHLLALFGPNDAQSLFGFTPDVYPRGHHAPTPTWAAYLDTVVTLPSDYLRKVDLASMAVPVETRAPLLDGRIQRAAYKLGRLNHASGLKTVLRHAAKLHLPAEIIDRPKRGFAIPVGEWFRTDFGGMRRLLLDHMRSNDPFPGLGDAGVHIDMGFVARMIREHDAAGEKSSNPWHGRDHSQRLYMLLVLSIWAKWLDRTRREHAAD